jgi:hypothetical protein
MAPRSSPLALALALSLVVASCQRRPRSPAEARARVEHDLAASDVVDLFQCLSQETRWAIEATYKDQRLMRTIIESKYPEEEAQRALVPLAAAAEDDPARYFARVARERRMLDGLRPESLRWQRGKNGAWGFSDLYPEWSREQDRASHAVSTVRENAALYQKAEPK